jgi:ribonuclease D
MFAENISSEEIEELELKAFEGPVSVLDTRDDDFADAVEYLEGQKAIGFDTETKPCFTHDGPRNTEALLQLSGADKAFIIRLHHLGLPKEIVKILSNPDIVKVGAAVKDDIHGLQAFRKFNPRGFVDLQKLAEEYGIADKSVRKMSAIILGFKVSKSQQLSNWEAPRLSGPQIKYAATDAWVCRLMYDRLMASEKHPLPPKEPAPEKQA